MKLASIALILSAIVSSAHSEQSNGGTDAVRLLRPDKELRSRDDGVGETKVKRAKSSKPNFQDLAPKAKSVKVQNKSGKVQVIKSVDVKTPKPIGGLTDSADDKPTFKPSRESTPKPSRKKRTPKPSQPEEPIPPSPEVKPTYQPTPCTKKPTSMPSPSPTCHCGDNTMTPPKPLQPKPDDMLTPFPTVYPTPVPCFDEVEEEDSPSTSPTTSSIPTTSAMPSTSTIPTISRAPTPVCTCKETPSPTEEENVPPSPTKKPTRKPTKSPQYYFDTLPPTGIIDYSSGKPSPAPTVSWMPSVWKTPSEITEDTPPIGSKAVGSKASTNVTTGSKATGTKTSTNVTTGSKATGPMTANSNGGSWTESTTNNTGGGGSKATGQKTTTTGGGSKATGQKTTTTGGGAKKTTTGQKTTTTTGGAKKTTGQKTSGAVPSNTGDWNGKL